MSRVLNKRTDVISPDAVYVGRPSKWGNPFRLDGADGYRILIARRIVFDPYHMNLSELRGKDLVCWGAPLPCHADVLLELANPVHEEKG